MVREAGKWELGMRHFDVKLSGGMVPNEGKTLVATVPSFHNALMGLAVARSLNVEAQIAHIDAQQSPQSVCSG